MLRFAILSLLACGAASAQDYALGADSQRHDGVPKGTVTKKSWASKIFPGTTRSYWIYVPAQYNAEKPACVTIFQDGGGLVSDTGAWRVPIVLDNLIAKGEMPVTIGIFIDPGVLPAPMASAQNRYNRSYEYDGISDRYARFLIEEILPEVGKEYNLSKIPDDRAIAGSSSGGIAAFVAAWNRPDAFRRVVSFIGSYTGLRGGDTLATLIRKTEPKPIRVFMQDGRADQDIYSGNWFLGNQQIYSALQFAGYESTLVIGTEGHNSKHGAAILPDALRWIWKDYPKPIAKPEKANDRSVSDIIEFGKDWEFVGGAYQLTADSTVDKEGNIFFSDHRKNRIGKIDVNGKISIWKEDSGGSHGVAFGPDGRLYAGQHDRKRIVAFAPDGSEKVIAEGMQTHHLTVTSNNEIYFADPVNHRVWFVDASGAKRVVQEQIAWPHAIHPSPDQTLLVVNDPRTKWVWSFQIQRDGSLANGEPFYRLETTDESSESDAGGMVFDTDGFLYVATNRGLQICDQPGRVMGILNAPTSTGINDVVFGGSDMQWLYVNDGENWYRRHVKRRGATPWNPVKPPQPRL